MSLFKIDIDDREREAVTLFDVLSGKRKVETTVKRLTIGDFAVWFQDSLKILFERKTWDDLASSIKDGRLDEQLKNMLEVKNKTGCVLIVLVEGVPRKQHGHIEFASLKTKLDHIVLGDRAHVMYSNNTPETVQRIFELTDSIEYDVSDLVAQGADIKLLTTTKERGLEQQLLDVFASVPQISMNTARLLIKNKWTFMDLYEATDDALASLVYPSGNTMPIARVRKITEAVGTKKCWINALSQITGVTKKTAQHIMNTEADPYKWDVETISKISKGKKNIGRVVARRIIQVLSYK